MTKLTLCRPVADGTGSETDIEIDVAAGESVMVAAVRAGVEGIVADCGGQCQCATCHVYVPAEFESVLPAMSEDEDDMLEITASERTARSRLSCQLVVPEGLDRLVVELPRTQR